MQFSGQGVGNKKKGNVFHPTQDRIAHGSDQQLGRGWREPGRHYRQPVATIRIDQSTGRIEDGSGWRTAVLNHSWKTWLWGCNCSDRG